MFLRCSESAVRRSAAALLLYFTTVGSAQSAETEVGSMPLQGVDTPKETPTVVLCLGVSSLDCNQRCSGVMISPHVVLTARHCAEAVARDTVRCDRDQYSGELSPANRVWVTGAGIPVTQAAHVRGVAWTVPLSTLACGADVALLELESKGTWGDWVAEPLFPDVVSVKDSYIAEGYGPTQEGATNGNHRRFTAAGILCSDKRDSCRSVGDGSTLTKFETLTTAQVCRGDSGGPLLTSNRLGVLGVLVRGFEANSSCGLGVFQRLGSHRRLIARTVVKTSLKAKEAPPAWTEAALAQSNAPPSEVGALGTSCDGAEDCPGSTCVSFDGRLNWQCAKPCEQGSCSDGSLCRDTETGEYCNVLARRSEPGCSATAVDAGIDAGLSPLIPLGALALVWMRRSTRWLGRRAS